MATIACAALSVSCIYGAYHISSTYCKPFFWWLIILICIDFVALVYQITLYDDICDNLYDDKDDAADCSSSSRKAFTFTWGVISVLLQIYFVFVIKTFIDLVKYYFFSNYFFCFFVSIVVIVVLITLCIYPLLTILSLQELQQTIQSQ